MNTEILKAFGSEATVRTAMLVFVFAAMSVAVTALAPQTYAELPMSAGLASSLQEGRVTSVKTDSVEIDGKEFQIAPKAVIKADAGAPRTLEDLTLGNTVHFRLNEGRIDLLIVIQDS